MGGMGLSTPCNVCHDPHASGYDKLINFDTSVVSGVSGQPPRYESLGNNYGRCYLSCHGRTHNPCTYNNGAVSGCGMMGGGGGGGGGH